MRERIIDGVRFLRGQERLDHLSSVDILKQKFSAAKLGQTYQPFGNDEARLFGKEVRSFTCLSSMH